MDLGLHTGSNPALHNQLVALANHSASVDLGFSQPCLLLQRLDSLRLSVGSQPGSGKGRGCATWESPESSTLCQNQLPDEAFI